MTITFMTDNILKMCSRNRPDAVSAKLSSCDLNSCGWTRWSIIVSPGFRSIFSALLLLTSMLAQALESDRDQPIRIQADAAMVNESEGNSTYRGNVIITQGTLRVSADEVEIFTADSEVIQIIAKSDQDSGGLAKYSQQTNAAKDMVNAEAKKITYLVQEERLHLAGAARLEQVRDVFTGDLLYYDMGKGIVSLNSTGGSDRVNMTITPKKKP